MKKKITVRTGSELYALIKKQYQGYGTAATDCGISKNTMIKMCNEGFSSVSVTTVNKVEKTMNIIIMTSCGN